MFARREDIETEGTFSKTNFRSSTKDIEMQSEFLLPW